MKNNGTIIRLIKKWWFWLALAVIYVAKYFLDLLSANIESFDNAGKNLYVAAFLAVVAVVLFAVRKKIGQEPVFVPQQKTNKPNIPQTDDCLEMPVKGVTFDNDDGTSRQKNLCSLYEKGDIAPSVSLRHYLYKGTDAIHVLAYGKIVGSVPKEQVAKVLDLMEKELIKYAFIRIENFYNEDDELIYRADLFVGHNPV